MPGDAGPPSRRLNLTNRFSGRLLRLVSKRTTSRPRDHEEAYFRLGTSEASTFLHRFGFPIDFRGKRVLDYGCGNGALSARMFENGFGAELVGVMQKVLETSVEYAKNRVQFGRPIGTFQAVQHRCADLKVAVDSGRMLTYQAACKLDQGMPAGQKVAMAKAQSGTLSRTATQAGHSIFAGISFTVEHDMQLYSARAKIPEANLGDTEYHLDQLAAAGVLRPLAGRLLARAALLRAASARPGLIDGR